jgi:hypothetical protein
MTTFSFDELSPKSQDRAYDAYIEEANEYALDKLADEIHDLAFSLICSWRFNKHGKRIAE